MAAGMVSSMLGVVFYAEMAHLRITNTHIT